MLELNIQAQWRALDTYVDLQRRKNHHPRLERLICAAVSNARLASLLVRSPAAAIDRYEVARCLNSQERRLVLSIVDAEDIYDFAGRLHAAVLAMHSEPAEAQIAEPNEAPVVGKPAFMRQSHRAPRHELQMAGRISTHVRSKQRHRTVQHNSRREPGRQP